MQERGLTLRQIFRIPDSALSVKLEVKETQMNANSTISERNFYYGQSKNQILGKYLKFGRE
jgi:hypothetical protein